MIQRRKQNSYQSETREGDTGKKINVIDEEKDQWCKLKVPVPKFLEN